MFIWTIQVLGLSAGACGKASQLLANVQQVAVQLDGDVGQDLDCRGAKVADAAQSLLTTAQVMTDLLCFVPRHDKLIVFYYVVSTA